MCKPDRQGSFFDQISRGRLICFLHQRIRALRMIRLIPRWLKAGISEAGVVSVGETGTGQAPPQQPATAKPDWMAHIETARLVHLTDLHYGRGFNDALWDHIKLIVPGLQPHVILVTGDLVNSPWKARLRKIREMLDELKKSTQGTDSLLYVIPGNHDTRAYGIIPLPWITPLICTLSALVLLAGGYHLWPYLWLLIIPPAVIAITCRYILLRRFTKFFGDIIPSQPITLPSLSLIIYPFDSSTYWASWARGAITPIQFVNACKATTETAHAPYRLAIVHHHTIPIPYDHNRESMMIMNNAGAFLSEIAKHRVRLVLSGHKHHQHMSRVTINAETSDETELTVLNTGTATAGRCPAAFGHNFNFIEIHPYRGAQITPYRSKGGTFDAQPRVWAESVERVSRSLFRENLLRHNCHCKSVDVTVVIGPDGDGFRTTKVRGFHYSGPDSIKMLPVPIRASADTGQIECLRVEPYHNAPINRQLQWLTRKKRKQHCNVALTKEIDRNHPPFDFDCEWHESNAYAMSAQQFFNVYQNPNLDATEYVEHGLEYLPAEEINLRVRLPKEFVIKREPTLSVMRGQRVEQRFQDAYTAGFSFDKYKNEISVRLPFGPLGLRYRIEWALSNEPPPAGHRVGSLEGEAMKAANRLLEFAKADTPSKKLLTALLEGIEEEARKQFTLDGPDKDPLKVNIMAFDPSDRTLRIALATHPIRDPSWFLEYGDGIAGRAYKTNGASLFVKANAVLSGAPFYYALPGDEALSDNGTEIAHAAILSLPLTHPKQRDSIFGILNISSNQDTSHLVDLVDDDITGEFRDGVSAACFRALLA